MRVWCRVRAAETQSAAMGSSQSVACCVRRGREAEVFDQPLADRKESWHSIPDAEEHWRVIDEQAGLPGSPKSDELRGEAWIKLRGRPLKLVPEEEIADISASPCRVSKRGTAEFFAKQLTDEERSYLPLVPQVAEAVAAEWNHRREHPEGLCEKVKAGIEEAFPELEEWTADEVCLRFLRAMSGDEKAATQLLVRAIECRVRDREMYTTLHCEVTCDIRVIGRDNDMRPTVYLCLRSQTRPLREMAPQVLLAFEAAVKLSHKGQGQIVLIADMHGFTPSLNMDPSGFMDLSGTFGSVFADRFASVMVVDFSIVAQGLWSLLKPLLSEKTQKKINFVSSNKARGLLKERYAEPTFNRIISSFDINRDRHVPDNQLKDHALHTSICDVPLGYVRPANVAG